MQVAEERKNAGRKFYIDDADIPEGLERLDLIMEADERKRQREDAEIEEGLGLGGLAIQDDEEKGGPEPRFREEKGGLGALPPDDDDDYEEEPFGPDGDPYAGIEILDDDDENWRSVDGFPNYEVSNRGKVRFARTGRIRKLQPNGGYETVQLSRPGYDPTTLYVHRLVATAWIPNPENKPEVDHIDRDKKNNMVHNLRWCTRSENNYNRGLFRKNTTGFVGVTRVGRKFRADVRFGGRQHYLGLFDTVEEAAAVRREAEARLHAEP